MPGQHGAGTLVDRLELMFDWYKGMVDQHTGRLLYLYDPENGFATGDGEPIRDIAGVWDLEVLSAFLGRDDLLDLTRRSLAHFEHWVIGRDGYGIVAPGGESPSIAHSAFLALALAGANLPDKAQRLAPLAEGILRQQRQDPAVIVFFANWQSQAGRTLFAATSRPEVQDLVRGFVFELQDRVIESGFYDRLARRPQRQAVVEVACALEGLADAYALAISSRDRRGIDYRRCIKTALGFLVRAQRTTDCTDRERGGFGGSLASREQRIDVTGHVASGFVKSVENGISVPT